MGSQASGSRSPEQVTAILNAACEGDAGAAEQLLPLVYEELRQLARREMGAESPAHTLQPTALVHEAYLRLFGGAELHWDSRAHFFGAAARSMRQILVDAARRRQRKKRGGEFVRKPLEHVEPIAIAADGDLLVLDEALGRLEAIDARKNEVVVLRYFGGLTVAETARALGVSPATVKSDWQFARAWLYDEIGKDDES